MHGIIRDRLRYNLQRVRNLVDLYDTMTNAGPG